MNNPDLNNTAMTKKVSIKTLQKMKTSGEKFVTVALYDAPMAAMAQKCGVEVVLVGDSLGMTVLGYDNTIPVTLDNMIYHIEAVARKNTHSLIIGDLPFMTYAEPTQALQNAARVMQAGAHMVKIEGGAWLSDTIQILTKRGIPVCAHLGLTPQSIHKFGGFRVQGRDSDGANNIAEDANTLEKAGADALVLEAIPAKLGTRISQNLDIPTIGIGAGPETDAQVLVINDILGLTEHPPKFSKNFLIEAEDIPGALQKYVRDVKNGSFPEARHTF